MKLMRKVCSNLNKPRARYALAALFGALLVFAALSGLLGVSPPGAAGGLMRGEFNATPTGAATFQIPLDVPPGIQGLQPSLSLAYHSQNPTNSVTGVGWSLGGTSVIERCPRNRAIDGDPGAVSYWSSDRLCMDGARLVPRQAYTDDRSYWAGDKTYSKELEDWSEVVRIGWCANGPCKFEVFAPGGHVATYGGTGDSQVYSLNAVGGQRQIRQWLLSELRDRNGNTIQFTYASGGAGTAVLQRISYDNRSVDFVYENRGDARDQILFSDGTGQASMTRLLRSVRVNTAAGEFKRYDLAYARSAATGRSRLEQVKECSAAACLDPISVSWNDQAAPDGGFRLVTPGGGEYQSDLRFDPGANIIPGDFNGDGKTDFIRQERSAWANDSNKSFSVYLSYGNGAFHIVRPTGADFQEWMRDDHGVNIIPGDYNGDGKTDFIRQEKGAWDDNVEGTFSVYFSRGDGNFNIARPGGGEYQDLLRHDPGVRIIPGDFNGDGKTDFLRQEQGGWDDDGIGGFDVYFSRGNGYFDIRTPANPGALRFDHGVNIITGDYNGDGITDFIRQEKGGWDDDETDSFQVYLSRGDGNFTIVTPGGVAYQKDLRFDPGTNIIPGDFNGDGKTDFIAQGNIIWAPSGDRTFFRVYLSRGDGYFDIRSNRNLSYHYNGWLKRDWASLIPIDYNGDGKTDFIRQEIGEKADDEIDSFQVYVSRGDGFFDMKDPSGWHYDAGLRNHGTGGTGTGAVNIIPGDFDADGRTDFIRQEKGSWDDDTSGSFQLLFASPTHAQEPLDTVASIEQGAITHAFEYRRLAEYDSNAGMSYPPGHIGISGALAVLQTYTRGLPTATESGTGAQTIRRNYYFLGATAHLGGRGFQGFQQMNVTAPEEGVSSVSTFHASFPLAGRPARSETKTADGQIYLSTSTYSWRSVTGASPESRAVQMIAQEDQTLAADGRQANRTSVNYDSLGNPILMAKSDGGRTLYVCSRFANNAAAKRPGLPTSRIEGTACNASGDSCACSRRLTESRVTLDARGNAIETRTYDSSRDDWLVETSTYDDRGNRIRSVDPAGAVTELTYESAYHTYPETITIRADEKTFTESRSYDARSGAVTRVIDVNGNETRYDYDAFGRPTAVQRTGPQGLSAVESHRYERDAAGLYSKISSIRQAWDAGAVTTQKEVRDALGRIVEQSAGGGADRILRLKQWGARGELLRESEAHRAGRPAPWILYAYDARLQASQITHPTSATARMSYGYGGVCASHQRRITTIISGGTGRHTIRCESPSGKTERLVMTDPQRGVSTTQTYAYDALDRLVGAVDGNSTTRIDLDSLGRKTRIESTDRGVVQYIYNDRGQIATEINNGEEKIFTFDSLQRETRIEYHDGSYALFDYDDASFRNAKGYLTRARMFTPGNRESSRREYSYDAAGKVAVAALTMNGSTYTMGYQLDPQGREQEIRFPDGKRACYRYDAEGFLTDIRIAAGDCATAGGDSRMFAAYSDYSAAGQPGRVEYGNGVITSYDYDGSHRLVSATTLGRDMSGANATLLDQHYTWTALGEVAAIEDRAGENDASYAYDGFGYLVRATGLYGDLYFEYDAAGNMTRKEDRALFYEGNRPTAADDGLELTYDVHGNVIRRETGEGTVYDLEYDGMYKIRRIARDGVLAGTYEYDAGGQRVKKIDGYGIETIYVTPDFEIARYPDDRVLTTRYISGPAGRVGAVTTENDELAGGVGAGASAALALQAQMYNTASISGLFGFAEHWIASAALDPRNVAAVQTLFWALCSAACLSIVLAHTVWTARTRGLVGRWRALAAARLADAGVLRPQVAAALAVGGALSDYERRRRRLLAPAPLMACVMLAFGLQCGGGGGDAPMLLAPGNALFASDAELGPGKNGYGYAVKGTFYFQQDQVGSTSLVTDEDGRVAASTIYKPYGEVYQDGSEGRDIYRRKFNGNEWDRDGGMYYFNARYYDPALGTFLQADDLLFGTDGEHPATLNCYAFSGNNPVTFSDPSGNFFPLLFAIAGLVKLAIGTAVTTMITAATAVMASAYSFGAAAIATGASWFSAFSSAAMSLVSWTTASNIIQYSAWYALTNGAMYAGLAKWNGEEFDVGKFFGAVGVGLAAGVAGGLFFSGFMLVAGAATAGSRVAQLATGTAWIGGGMLATGANSAGYQWAVKGHIDPGWTVLSAVAFGGGGSALAMRFQSLFSLGNLKKYLPELGGVALLTTGVGTAIGVTTQQTIEANRR